MSEWAVVVVRGTGGGGGGWLVHHKTRDLNEVSEILIT